MDADNQVAVKPAGAIKLKCAWHKCGKEFEPTQKSQTFCRPECRHAHNNWRKMHGHILAPRIEDKLQRLANGQQKPVDQMLNEILDVAIPTPGQSLSEAEIKGINQVAVTEGNNSEDSC